MFVIKKITDSRHFALFEYCPLVLFYQIKPNQNISVYIVNDLFLNSSLIELMNYRHLYVFIIWCCNFVIQFCIENICLCFHRLIK